MSGFMFNFSLDTSGGEASGVGGTGGEESCKSPGPTPVPKSVPVAKQIPVLPFHGEIASVVVPSVFSIPGSGTKLYYISGSQVYDIVRDSKTDSNAVADSTPVGMELKSLLTLSDSQHSDLIPEVYEGGLKLWECALDLVGFLSESNIVFSGMKILELGCGTGLPGIYSAVHGARTVHFQDYNPEVLNYITIPSVILNTGPDICGLNAGNVAGGHSETGNGTGDRVSTGNETGNVDLIAGNGDNLHSKNGTGEQFKFYSGDWSELVSILKPVCTYDMILTSETIYSLASQPKLLSVLKQLSARGTGVVYVAAKTFYFGVGGGVDSFCQLVEEDGTFNVHHCRKMNASVPRVILKLTHKDVCCS